MYIAYERSDQYRATKKLKHDGNNTSRITGTKKCGCPFDMRAHRSTTNDEWTLTVVCGLHNHPPAEHLGGHSYARRLSKDEKALLMEMSKSMVRPKDILVTLKQRDTLNKASFHECYTKDIPEWQTFIVSLAHQSLLKEFSSYPDAVNYVMDTWLVPYKEKFVTTWTDTAESAHAKLKRQLGSCQVSFEASFEKIHSLLELQHTDIKALFEKSLIVVQHQFKPSQFRELRGNASISALEYLLVESNRANSIGIDVETCGCVLCYTHGLPCAHEISNYIRQDRSIPLATIHSQWRQLHISICNKEKETKVTCHAEVELFVKKFNEIDRTIRLEFLKKLKEIVCPGSTFLVEPEVKPKTCSWGRKKINVSTRRDPCAFELVLKPYIKFAKDVAIDGNCDFWAIVASIGHTEDDWAQVRRDLLGKLHTHKEEYITLYGSYASNLSPFYLLEQCQYLNLIDMRLSLGLSIEIILSRYKRNLSFCAYTESYEPGYPVSSIATNWRKYRHPCAVDWDDAYMRCIQHFKDIIHDTVAT
ncbi:uncharacterized protein LOC114280171 [Camellia sinensis]|uniref:uncharacterized protein LOC114280171 n=1 Tax=Camellia sinensis TaxID=4442 RepID=UPI001035E0B4|nr:uncharacterized protein LOC114280171 [Camellia sinensis]